MFIAYYAVELFQESFIFVIIHYVNFDSDILIENHMGKSSKFVDSFDGSWVDRRQIYFANK